ncbi:MAG: glycerophosphodiester phosphodiesterase family protein, partial [Clostridia bacterium]|nr:glycerophosphodiester phosphodiesterase family protein [Clostridia bacterium]
DIYPNAGSGKSYLYPDGVFEDSSAESGGIAAMNMGTIEDCKTLEGTSIYHGGINCGGIAGVQIEGGTITGCENNASVTLKGTKYPTDATFIGSVGIVTNDYNAVIEYYEKFEDNTLSAPPLIVAHRGDIENHPHNVLSSFISAAQSGADIAELDVWMTADGHLVLNHDATTTGFDKAISCTESTREQLKALKSTSPLASADDEIAFYDELMDYFSKNYKDLIFIVEIKDRRNEVIDRVMELTREYGMEDRILIICTTHSIVRYAYEKYGIGIQMNRSYMLDTTYPASSIADACIECAQLKTSFFTRWQESNQYFATLLRHRGIKYSPWTTSTAYNTDKDYLAGYPEFTTNYPHCSDTYVRYVTATVSSDGSVIVQRVNYDGSVADITGEVKIVVIEGNVKLEGNKLIGNGTFAFEFEAELPLYKEQTYFVYSQAYTN